MSTAGQHVGLGVALHGAEASIEYTTSSAVSSRPFTGGLGWKRTPLPELEDVGRLVRLAPRLGEVALELERPGRIAGPALCLSSRLWVKV